MGRKAVIGITNDFLDKNGKWIMPGPGLKVLDEMPNVAYKIFSEYLLEVTPEQIKDVDIVINLSPRWTKHTLSGNEHILAVLRRGVGYDNIDIPALTKAGIMLTITPAAIRRPMAEVIMTFMLSLSRLLLKRDRLIREGRWTERPNLIGYGLEGKTLGLIGVGNIGHEVFTLAKPFGMRHIAFDPYVTQGAVSDINVELVDMDTLLAESDFLTICCLLSAETHHLIGEKELRKMKKTSFLINAARGPIVDEATLIIALQERWIEGAGLDVFEEEPISPDNPLLKMDNTILTPHSMCWADRTMIGQWDELMKQVSQIIHGEIPNGLVNREVLDNPKFQSKTRNSQKSLK